MKNSSDDYTIGTLLQGMKEEHEEHKRVALAVKESLSFEVLQALTLEVLKEDRSYYKDGDDTPLLSAYDLIIKYYGIPEDW